MVKRKGLGQANILRTNNNTSTGYGVAYADEVSGHRTVGNLTALYALNDWQLSASGDNTNSDAVGQLWYVVNADGNGNGCYYQLKDWSKRKEAAGWSEFKGTGGEVDLSGYATTSALNDAVAGIDTKLAQKVDTTYVQDLNGDTLYIVDSQDNIIAKIGADGIHSIEVEAGGKKLTEMQNEFNITSILEDFYEDELIIADSKGYVVARYTKDGFETINEKVFETSFFRNKQYFTVGDSLCNSGQWQQKFSSINGSLFSQETNKDHYSKGGTQTLDVSGQCEMDRLRLLYNEEPDAKIIFLQNVNDANRGNRNIGTNKDTPFFAKYNVVYSTTYNTKAEAESAKNTAIAATTPNVGTLLRIPYTVRGKLLNITKEATSSGTLTLTINGSTFGISVNAGDSAYKIAAKIEEWDFSSIGIGDSLKVTEGTTKIYGVVFKDTTGTGVIPDISLSVGSTGVTYNIIDADSESYVGYCFTSYQVREWNDTSKWVTPTEISLWSLYKGLIEYAITQFPTAYIAFVGLPHLNFNSSSSSYKREDGSYDWDKCYDINAWLRDLQKDVCKYMRIPFFDVTNDVGINIYNYFNYYPNNNVHPNSKGYDRWGECLARLVE